ncbi:transcription repressor OFP16-like [Mercurialis annua]|uniref:transcription repressor OFP16-like n=1 Tax=Mercurialis annua TaxID=3986 RepID=UPI00215F16E8|nr:transcription repressor OFP16-like [Mercurialis annua]
MPGKIGTNLHLCFTKIKNPLELDHSPSNPHHPLVVQNYNSLFETKSPPGSSSSSSSSSSSAEPDFATVFASNRFFFSSPGRSNSIIESTPSLVTPTESSNSLVSLKCIPQSDRSSSESMSSSPSTVKNSVAVPTYSPDPYLDFRRSMQEMVEARELVDVKANWDYLHELLLCYLALNPKSTHKFIVRAFADLLVSLLASPPLPPPSTSTVQQAEGGD